MVRVRLEAGSRGGASVTTISNAYCAVLGIRAPRVAPPFACETMADGSSIASTPRSDRRLVHAFPTPSLLADEQGYEIPRAEVQRARLLDGPRESH